MPEQGSNTTICILGMHRSGTSCLAGSLEERGLFLGDVNSYATYNLRGNKESRTCMEINNDILALSGGSWDKPPKKVVWNDDLRQRRDAHIGSYEGHEMWGFKDPRTVFTLPFWLEAIPKMRFVGTFRHPDAVARSLLRRGPNLAPVMPPLELWRMYNLGLLDIASRFEVPLVCFDWPPAKYARALDAVADHLHLDADGDVPLEFYEHGLRTSDHHDGTPGAAGPEDVRVYEELMRHTVDLAD